jgi:cytochrome P450
MKTTMADPIERASGPISPEQAALLAHPPSLEMHWLLALLRFNQRHIQFVFRARRELGEVFALDTDEPNGLIFTSIPDDVRSLFTARPEQAPSFASESPLRPILGPNSVLTSLGERHMRQRKLLLPPFHGEAIERYLAAITEATECEIDRWPLNEPFSLVPHMQAITLEVIMTGIFGIEGKPDPNSAEGRLRSTVRTLVKLLTRPLAQLVELMNMRREEPLGVYRTGRAIVDRRMDAVIGARRRTEDLAERRDILSLLLQATDDEGKTLTDAEIRDELLTLVLAGHETTANSLAWAWERLLRNPSAHERLVETVRSESSNGAATNIVEATITETMRSRPVVPLVGRRVMEPWQLGPYAVPADTPVLVSILLLHHREDLYPEPFEFRPERWLDTKPGTYEWIPFGVRHPSLPRCLAGDGRAACRPRGNRAQARPRRRRSRARAGAASQRDHDPAPGRPGRGSSTAPLSSATLPRCGSPTQI